MPSVDEQRARGYARQALSDYQVYRMLSTPSVGLPPCHALQHLQMFLEKASKAYFWEEGQRPRRPTGLQTSHALVSKGIPMIYLRYYAALGVDPGQPRLAQLRALCREIDLLSPAVDHGGRPDNCEYPWEQRTPAGDRIVVAPVDHAFGVVEFMETQSGRSLVKVALHFLEEICA